jgi:uncharacterized membrane protein YukC
MVTLLKPVRFLKSEKAKAIAGKLTRLTAGNIQSQALISNTLRQIEKKEKWESYKWIVVLLITVAICWLIWYSAS